LAQELALKATPGSRKLSVWCLLLAQAHGKRERDHAEQGEGACQGPLDGAGTDTD